MIMASFFFPHASLLITIPPTFDDEDWKYGKDLDLLYITV